MLKNKTIGFIGAGNMAMALIKGLIAAKFVSPGGILVSDKDKKRLVHAAETYEVKVYNKNYEVAKAADIILLAVKPPDLDGVLKDIAPEMEKGKLIISIAAGRRIDSIMNTLASSSMTRRAPVVRAMPNTPSLIGHGAIGLFRGQGVSDSEFDIAHGIFKSVGAVIEVKDEALLDSVTGLSGSGPAYVFLFMDALIEAGVREGLSRDDAKTLVVKTTLGSAKLAMESDTDLKELIRMVSSPGGTTVEGLNVLEKKGFNEIIASAVAAAAKRARQLSE